ncbi:nuclear transport factor 2 family protein [Polaribacter marinivivus]|uniref:nuclear transport factor 2 family protein n=1 Tax=Polaribacter marinivivus TaxID=1524260 RepID=UPI003D34232E
MQKIIPFLLLLISSLVITAQEKNEQQEVKKVIETFFIGLHKGDSTIMKSTLHKDIKIQTTFTNREGLKNLNNQSRQALLTGVANKKPENVYLEKLLSYDIKIDGNLASVWTPYEFYLNDNFSHCGANSFQLFNNNGKWQIIYIVDMRRRDNCKALKDKK